jgi:hypothetical protein
MQCMKVPVLGMKGMLAYKLQAVPVVVVVLCGWKGASSASWLSPLVLV